MKDTKGHLIIWLLIGALFIPSVMYAEDQSRSLWRHKYNHEEPGIIGEFVLDILRLHGKLFTWDSYKVLAGFFPPFIAARMADERIHCCFYDRSCHKNVNQMPHWCKKAARFGIAIPIVGLGSMMFWSSDEDKRMTSYIFLLGMPFIIFGKDVIKKFRIKACLRPWNEHFSCEERASGGFPSGHMAEAAYMLVLYGKRFGPKFAVPLSFSAAFLAATFISCNRHLVSQMVAGFGLGTMFALAADKLIDSKLAKRRLKNVDVAFDLDHRGAPAIKFAFKF